MDAGTGRSRPRACGKCVQLTETAFFFFFQKRTAHRNHPPGTRETHSCEQRGGHIERRTGEWQRGITSHPLRGSGGSAACQSECGNLKKHRGWVMPGWRPSEPCRHRWLLAGSLCSGSCTACGWSVVQLRHNEEMGPMHGLHGTLDAELVVQRAVKRAELTAFWCLLGGIIDPITAHLDNKGIIDGLQSGDIKCIGPREKDAVMWILMMGGGAQSSSRRYFTGSRPRRGTSHQEGEKHEMMLFRECVTAGNERAHRLATDGAMSMLDGGDVAQIRASAVQQRRGGLRHFARCS